MITNVADIITLMMEAASSSETSVNVYQTTWCSIPEDSHLHILVFFCVKFSAVTGLPLLYVVLSCNAYF
jgi:hypothetical protein